MITNSEGILFARLAVGSNGSLLLPNSYFAESVELSIPGNLGEAVHDFDWQKEYVENYHTFIVKPYTYVEFPYLSFDILAVDLSIVNPPNDLFNIIGIVTDRDEVSITINNLRLITPNSYEFELNVSYQVLAERANRHLIVSNSERL